MNPIVLAWALSSAAPASAKALAAAYVGATTRVTVDGRTVEYRSLAEIADAATALHGAIGGPEGAPAAPMPRGPSVTLARFSRAT